MVDLSRKGSQSEEMNNGKTSSEDGEGGSHVKTCVDCGTTKTPLWRGGPAGPKSLCNACGIRSRKKRRALLGINKVSTEENKKSKKNNNQSQKSGNNGSSKLGDSLRRKLLAVGREVVWQRSTVEKLRRRRQLGEEEQAAVLLMALSCGSVYA